MRKIFPPLPLLLHPLVFWRNRPYHSRCQCGNHHFTSSLLDTTRLRNGIQWLLHSVFELLKFFVYYKVLNYLEAIALCKSVNSSLCSKWLSIMSWEKWPLSEKWPDLASTGFSAWNNWDVQVRVNHFGIMCCKLLTQVEGVLWSWFPSHWLLGRLTSEWNWYTPLMLVGMMQPAPSGDRAYKRRFSCLSTSSRCHRRELARSWKLWQMICKVLSQP